MGYHSSARFFALVLSSVYVGTARALDIAFDEIQCDQSLPAYALADNIHMTCNDGESTRCSFGQDVVIRGSLQYNGLNQSTYNGTGYASANLRLLSVEYSLFEYFPINMCGNWIESYNNTDSGDVCPNADGLYYFNVHYTLPWDDDDITMWFATGWQGVSTLQVRSDEFENSTLVTDCTLHWHTYVTPSQEDGWKTMPSAAQTGIVLAAVLTSILCCCMYMTCCRRRKKHVTDVGYYDDLSSDYVIYDEKKPRKKDQKSRERIDKVEESRRK